MPIANTIVDKSGSFKVVILLLSSKENLSVLNEITRGEGWGTSFSRGLHFLMGNLLWGHIPVVGMARGKSGQMAHFSTVGYIQSILNPVVIQLQGHNSV